MFGDALGDPRRGDEVARGLVDLYHIAGLHEEAGVFPEGGDAAFDQAAPAVQCEQARGAVAPFGGQLDLLVMAVAGGVPDGNGGVHPFKRIDQTFYSFQEKAQYSVQSIGSVHDLLTMEDLLTFRGQAVLDSHPALSRKLVVFFVLAYRYFHDSGHAPDFRPDDAGLDLFVRGIWGYKTRNVLITIGKDKKGRPIEQIRFVDNKDQFKQYRRFEDSERPLGLIKHGIRLVEPVVRPAMERSIGMYVQKVADQEGIEPADIPDLPKLVASVARQVMQSGVDSALVHSGAILHDAIDDTSNAVERVLRKMPRRKGR